MKTSSGIQRALRGPPRERLGVLKFAANRLRYELVLRVSRTFGQVSWIIYQKEQSERKTNAIDFPMVPQHGLEVDLTPSQLVAVGKSDTVMKNNLRFRFSSATLGARYERIHLEL